jgi:hypothetical protein
VSTSFGVVVRNGLHDVQNESAGADVHGPTEELGLAGRLHAFEEQSMVIVLSIWSITYIVSDMVEHNTYVPNNPAMFLGCLLNVVSSRSCS